MKEGKLLVLIAMSLVVLGCGGGGESSSSSRRSNDESSNSEEFQAQSIESEIKEISTTENRSVVINVNSSFELKELPLNGTVEVKGNEIIYTPEANFVGQDSFSYLVGNSVVEVNVKVDKSQSYDISDMTIKVATNSFATLPINSSAKILKKPINGKLEQRESELIYIPNNNFTGKDNIKVEISGKEVNIDILVGSYYLTIGGRVSFDHIPYAKADSGYRLDYSNIEKKASRGVKVELVDSSNRVLQFTYTDENGEYRFSNVGFNQNLKVRAVCQSIKDDNKSGWNFKVVDNTDNYSIYSIEGKLAVVKDKSQIRNLHAPTEWDGEYKKRTGAPFAIMDAIYSSVETVTDDNAVEIPKLVVAWSKNNKPVSGDKNRGEISTTHYEDGVLYVLGDENSDTDEYDSHIIVHEFAHFYDEKFSRMDNIGGSHSVLDLLDIRVAFCEGWANAFSAISLNDPIYVDTYGEKQSRGWAMDIENGERVNAGWFNEGSVHRLIYDIYDKNNEDGDNLSLPFKRIHNVFVENRDVKAFSSIFTFITEFNRQNPDLEEDINSMLALEKIAPIYDIYGEGRENKKEFYPYSNLDGKESINVRVSNIYGYNNKLGNRAFVRVKVEQEGSYKIKVNQVNGENSDPDFYIYQAEPWGVIAKANESYPAQDEKKIFLKEGDYLIEILDFNRAGNVEYKVSMSLD